MTTKIETQEDLLGWHGSVMEAHGWKKDWVKISTAGYILASYSKDGLSFVVSFESMEFGGTPLPDVSDLYVD